MINRQIFEQLIPNFPSHAHLTLRQLFLAEDFCGVVTAAEVQILSQMLECDVEQLMLDLLCFAKQYAKPPISHFTVGAISQALSGNLYFGANMEFGGQSLNATVHAEQASVMNAWIHGEQGISVIAINGTPCGHCRQFLNELCTASQLRIITPKIPLTSLAELLPNAFGPDGLGNDSGFMGAKDHALELMQPSNEPTILAALAMANRSYAPYSGNYAGVAVKTESGRLYAAPYAENVAFNPSLSPLQGVLIMMNLGGISFEAIQKVVLVEIEGSLCSQINATSSLLSTISSASSVSSTEPVVKFAKGTE